jgi:hypothetical protein
MRDQVIRRWVDFTVAPFARWAVTDGNSFDLLFGGVIANGDYVVNLIPQAVVGGVWTDVDVAIATTVTRAANVPVDAAALATAMELALEAAIASTVDPASNRHVSKYLKRATVSSATVSVYVQSKTPRRFRVTATAPGAATITLAPNDTFPIDMLALGVDPQGLELGGLELTVVPVDSSRVQLPRGTLATDITVRRMLDTVDGATFVGDAEIEEDVLVGSPIRIPAGPGRYTFELGAVSGAIGSGVVAALELVAREVPA